MQLLLGKSTSKHPLSQQSLIDSFVGNFHLCFVEIVFYLRTSHKYKLFKILDVKIPKIRKKKIQRKYEKKYSSQLQIVHEHKRSHAFLGYRMCILKLKVAYFIYEVISGIGSCIAGTCELFIIQKLNTYLSTLLAHSQNVQPFTELSKPVDTTTIPVNTSILSPIPCSDQTKNSFLLLQRSTILKLNTTDKCILASAREEVLCQARGVHTHSGTEELNNRLIQREDMCPIASCSSSLFYFHLFAQALQTDNDLLSPDVKVYELLHQNRVRFQ